ncbi:MAG TPA: alpha/beta hydrolase [Chloroflexi bacterium]|nr:alpha/beta hydrolase [Chloroflexota bacterium]
MSAVVVNEGLIHYEAMGRGRPLVFIHGWLGSWRYWVPTMEELSARHRTYALDLWGFGDSDKPGRIYTFEAYVKLVRDFLDKLGVVHPTLVGHGLGGIIALKFAAENEGWVDQVMGVSVPLLGEAVQRNLSGFSGNGDALAKLAARRAKFTEVEMEVRKTDVSAVTQSISDTLKDDLRSTLPPLTIPALLVYGGNDPFIKPAEAEWLRRCEDNVRAISIDNAQHFPMLEEQNKFNRLLKQFLDAGNDLSTLELKEEWQRRLR